MEPQRTTKYLFKPLYSGIYRVPSSRGLGSYGIDKTRGSKHFLLEGMQLTDLGIRDRFKRNKVYLGTSRVRLGFQSRVYRDLLW